MICIEVGVSPIASSPPDPTTNIPATTSTPPAPGTPSDWVQAWLAQAEPDTEVAMPDTPRTQTQVRWFTLPQVVADIESLLEPTSPPQQPVEPTATPAVATTSVPAMPEEDIEKAPAAAAGNDVSIPIALPIQQPVTLPATPSEPQSEIKIETAPTLAAAPLEASDIHVSAPAGPEDKGELVWSAELALQPVEKQPAQKLSTRITHEGPVEAQPQSIPTLTAADANTNNQDPSQQGDAPPTEPPAPAAKPTARPKDDPVPPPAEHHAPQATAIPVVSADAPAQSLAPAKEAPPAPVIDQVVEPPAPFRPTQIATVQVDVPAPSGIDGDAPMRLVVSQRGDQVNIRLRSWDPAAAPIPDSQMRPLLDSLSAKGLVSERAPIERIGDPAHIVAEAHVEKLSTPTESAGANNDQQSFQNASDRQQQNQERQQQQQAFFLRKQLRNARTEEFTLPTAQDGNSIRY